jgi:hypothetical protein
MTLRKLPHFADLMGFAAGGGETHKSQHFRASARQNAAVQDLGTLKPHFRPVRRVLLDREKPLKRPLSGAKRVLRAPGATQAALVSAMSKWPTQLDIAPILRHPQKTTESPIFCGFPRLIPDAPG